jgi:hypothetical protein
MMESKLALPGKLALTAQRKMTSQEFLFKTIAWITARHLLHYQKYMEVLSQVGAFAMKIAAPDLYSHAEASLMQRPELHELTILKVCFELQKAAKLSGGWSEDHGYGLDRIAEVLVTEHDWEPEDVGSFVEDLTEGHFVFALNDDDDE